MVMIEPQDYYRRITRTAAVLLALLGGASMFTAPPRFTAGLLCGGLLCLFNFKLLFSQVGRAFNQGSRNRAKFFIQSRYFARIILSAIIIFALITRTGINIVGLLLGLSIIMLSIVGQALYAYVAQGGDI